MPIVEVESLVGRTPGILGAVQNYPLQWQQLSEEKGCK
jgi:hypothetical protein